MTLVVTTFGEDLSRPPFRKSRIASNKRATLEETYRIRQVFTFSFGRFSTKLNIIRTTGRIKMHSIIAIGRRALTGGYSLRARKVRKTPGVIKRIYST